MNHPEPAPASELSREFASALAWWQAAGVTHDFHDDATAWLAEAPLAPVAAPSPATRTASPTGSAAERASPWPAAPGEMPSAPPPASPTLTSRRDLLGESPPADLAAFTAWWMGAEALDTARGFPRVPPRGDAGAALMVLVPQPEEADRERLLEGPQGRLLANILAATGLAESATYIAAALPSHTPMADLAALAAGGMDAVTLHHIGLVRPARLLVLGTGLAPMLASGGGDGLREINHNGSKVPVMVSETLDALMNIPRLKARFWRRWMEWTATH